MLNIFDITSNEKSDPHSRFVSVSLETDTEPPRNHRVWPHYHNRSFRRQSGPPRLSIHGSRTGTFTFQTDFTHQLDPSKVEERRA